MKHRIMTAFIEEIHLNGMKFTMDDLAKRLGISKRTLYEHFDAKVDILDAIIDQSIADRNEITDRIIQDENLSLIEKIRGVITVLPIHWEFYDLRILDQMKRYYPQQWSKVDNELTDDWNALRLLITEAIEQKEMLDINVSLIMKLIIDGTNSTLDQRFYQENQITVSEALLSIVDILLYGLIPENKR
ncbi:TetR/AcrR family transcriptional regulator [Paenibacillus sp. FJAT-26967]|uniref:TetR/AcrR family transcriptional regulator n=1 Tax=Paenibacillus sp. FJAT-26967 TaxID=1729690 RepID=UPI000838455D|nr:TetR/AcrR family transcriptional regulator [Paenibacillus sp. FJAT-26967]